MYCSISSRVIFRISMSVSIQAFGRFVLDTLTNLTFISIFFNFCNYLRGVGHYIRGIVLAPQASGGALIGAPGF